MPDKKSLVGSELFIVDNSDEDWKAVRHLSDRMMAEIDGVIDAQGSWPAAFQTAANA